MIGHGTQAQVWSPCSWPSLMRVSRVERPKHPDSKVHYWWCLPHIWDTALTPLSTPRQPHVHTIQWHKGQFAIPCFMIPTCFWLGDGSLNRTESLVLIISSKSHRLDSSSTAFVTDSVHDLCLVDLCDSFKRFPVRPSQDWISAFSRWCGPVGFIEQRTGGWDLTAQSLRPWSWVRKVERPPVWGWVAASEG